MTPDRARVLSARWLVGTVTVVTVLLVVSFTGVVELTIPALAALSVGVRFSGYWDGWARGYRECRVDRDR